MKRSTPALALGLALMACEWDFGPKVAMLTSGWRSVTTHITATVTAGRKPVEGVEVSTGDPGIARVIGYTDAEGVCRTEKSSGCYFRVCFENCDNLGSSPPGAAPVIRNYREGDLPPCDVPVKLRFNAAGFRETVVETTIRVPRGVESITLDLEPVIRWVEARLLGDADGFGMGLSEGDQRPVAAGFFDNRTSEDPPFTDVQPAPREFSFLHSFAPPFFGIRSATLELFTLGISDGDNQVVGSDTDIRLYLDGQEVPGAFDEVDQFGWSGSEWVFIAGSVSIPIPAPLISKLEDGVVEVRIEILQLATHAGWNAIAIDFSEFLVEGK